SPSGRLVAATLTPLSPRMAATQNARGVVAVIRDETDEAELVASWSRAELVTNLFHFYCIHHSAQQQLLLPLHKFRHFANDAGIVGPADPSRGVASLGSNRLDILYTSCTRPLSGQKSKMNEEQFFEVLGALALWKFGGRPASS